ncbi:MAG: hypothetical protein QXD57_07500 [Ignisphaera sp.]
MNLVKKVLSIVLLLTMVMPLVSIPITYGLQVIVDNITFRAIRIIPTTSSYYGVTSRGYCQGQSCQLWNLVSIGNASIDVNVWGLQRNYTQQDVGSGEVVMTITNQGTLNVRSRWNLRVRPEYNTLCYHEVIYGAKPWGTTSQEYPAYLDTPIRYRDMPRLLVDLRYEQVRGIPGHNFAFEAWVFKDSNNGRAPTYGDIEVMVQTYISGGRPAGQPVRVITVPVIINGQVVNRDFELWWHPRADLGWAFITFKMVQGVATGHVVFDYTELMEYAKQWLQEINWSDGGVTWQQFDNMYFMALEFGTEIYTNQTLGMNVDVEWNLYRYYFALAPRTVSSVSALNAWAKVIGATPSPTPTPTPTTPTPTPTPTTPRITPTPTPTPITNFRVINILPTTSQYVGTVSRGYCSGGSCQLWNLRPIGNASIDVNLWGLSGRESQSSGEAVMEILQGGILRTRSQWQLGTAPQYNTPGYHEVIYGAKPWGTNPISEYPAYLDTLYRFYIDYVFGNSCTINSIDLLCIINL